MRKTTASKPKYASTDRVMTPDGPGMVIRQVPNLYLMRPGDAFEVELDNGDRADYNEHDLTR